MFESCGVVVAVEVLADEHGIVACIVEPGGYRGVLQSLAAKFLEAPQQRAIAQDTMVVGVLAPQDRRPGGAAQRIGHESSGEFYASTGQEVLVLGHVTEVRGSHVVGEHEE